MAYLTACLALVRPVGMQEGEVETWLDAASVAVEHLPADILADACAKVQRTVTHHGQIIPAIIAETAERYEGRKRVCTPRRELEALPSPYTVKRFTQSEVDEIVAERGRAMSVALDNGSIVHGPNGSFLPGKGFA